MTFSCTLHRLTFEVLLSPNAVVLGKNIYILVLRGSYSMCSVCFVIWAWQCVSVHGADNTNIRCNEDSQTYPLSLFSPRQTDDKMLFRFSKASKSRRLLQ